MFNNEGLYSDVIKGLQKIISDCLKINNNIYQKDLSLKVLNILFGSDNYNKQLFYDAFKHVQINDRRRIINICLIDIVSKIDAIISNSSKIKIDSIMNYVDNNNRKLIISIFNFLTDKFDEKADETIPEEIIFRLNDLNEFEKLIIKRMCLNNYNFTFNTISKLLKSINFDFYINPQNHYQKITEILDFCIPIYDRIERTQPIKIDDEKDYIKIDSINSVIKSFINEHDGTASSKLVIYYLFYEYLINFKFDENNKDYQDKVLQMIEQDNSNIDKETLNYLLNFYKNVASYYSLEEKIKIIKNLKQADLDPLINLYASFDIAEYENLKEKKKAFGLKI